jgi:phage terminase small subunit
VGLKPKHAQFVREYLVDLNATQAAIRAGYSEKSARVHASKLLTRADISAAVAARQSNQLQKADLTATRVLEELRRIAFSDPRELFDELGNLRPVKDITAEQASSIRGFEVLIKNAKAGDGLTDVVHKFQLWEKTKALEMLAKHFALLTERVQHEGGVELKWADQQS